MSEPKVTFHKTAPSHEWFGRGQDNHRFGAHYAAFCDGLQVATLEPRETHYMEDKTWDVYMGGVLVDGPFPLARAKDVVRSKLARKRAEMQQDS